MSTVKDIKKFLANRDDDEPVAWSCWTVEDFPDGENTPPEVVEETLDRLHENDGLAAMAYEVFMQLYDEVCSEQEAEENKPEYALGYAAYQAGVKYEDNPYLTASDAGFVWCLGWCDAEEDDQQ